MDTSYDGIRVTLPSSWQSLTDAQLYYVYGLIADNLSLSQMKAYCFFKFSGVNVLRRDGSNYVVTDGERRATVSPTTVAMAVRSLGWLDRLPTYPVRISSIKGNDAVDAALHGVAFGEYIALDNMYQGYLHGQDDSLLDEMAKIMYGNERLLLFGFVADTLGILLPHYGLPYVTMMLCLGLTVIEAKSVFEHYKRRKSQLQVLPSLVARIVECATHKDAERLIEAIKDEFDLDKKR